ncbi:MAG: hypothetical protein JJD92_12775 [Frankiaceae bacterium]|nr:hypothetical protein [Frankiaceae bacterium]
MTFNGHAILEVLTRYGVDFIVIGGFAAVAQGSPIPTNDVDITPERDRGNFARLSAALTELDAKVRAEGLDPMQFAHDADSLAAVQIWNLTTTYGDLDISVMPSGTRGYEDLRRDAVEIEIRGVRVLLASLADIVRSKDAAGRDKDRRALPVLRELLARQTRARAAGPDAPG